MNYNRSIRYNNKDLVLTGHFKNELYTYYKKNLDLIVDIFHTGTHNKESKDKSVVCMKTKGGKWELVKHFKAKGMNLTMSIVTAKQLLRYGSIKKLVWVFVWSGSNWRGD